MTSKFQTQLAKHREQNNSQSIRTISKYNIRTEDFKDFEYTDKDKKEILDENNKIIGYKVESQPKEYTISKEKGKSKGAEWRYKKGTYIPIEIQFDLNGNITKYVIRDTYRSAYINRSSGSKQRDYDIYDQVIATFDDKGLLRRKIWDAYDTNEDGDYSIKSKETWSRNNDGTYKYKDNEANREARWEKEKLIEQYGYDPTKPQIQYIDVGDKHYPVLAKGWIPTEAKNILKQNEQNLNTDFSRIYNQIENKPISSQLNYTPYIPERDKQEKVNYYQQTPNTISEYQVPQWYTPERWRYEMEKYQQQRQREGKLFTAMEPVQFIGGALSAPFTIIRALNPKEIPERIQQIMHPIETSKAMYSGFKEDPYYQLGNIAGTSYLGAGMLKGIGKVKMQYPKAGLAAEMYTAPIETTGFNIYNRIKNVIKLKLNVDKIKAELETKHGKNSPQVKEFMQEYNLLWKQLPRKIKPLKEFTVGIVESIKKYPQVVDKIDAIFKKHKPEIIGTTVIPPQTMLKNPPRGTSGDIDVQRGTYELAVDLHNALRESGIKSKLTETQWKGTTKYHVTIDGKEFANIGTSPTYYYGQIEPTLNLFDFRPNAWVKTESGIPIAHIRDQARVKFLKGYIEKARPKDITDVKGITKSLKKEIKLINKEPIKRYEIETINGKKTKRELKAIEPDTPEFKKYTQKEYSEIYAPKYSTPYTNLPYTYNQQLPIAGTYQYKKNQYTPTPYITSEYTPSTYTPNQYTPNAYTPDTYTPTEYTPTGYTPSNPYGEYTPYNPYTPKNPYITYTPNPKTKPPFIPTIKDEDKGTISYAPMYIKEDGSYEIGQSYLTPEEATAEGMEITDKTTHTDFQIIQTNLPLWKLKKWTKPVKNAYKFKRQGNTIHERKPYQNDKGSEKNNFMKMLRNI